MAHGCRLLCLCAVEPKFMRPVQIEISGEFDSLVRD
jgi:hypothetical protein